MKYCPQCKSKLVQEKIENKIRLHCTEPDCGYIFWDNPIPVVAALVEHEDSVILAHNAAWPAGMYAPITGFLEKGEKPESGVIREVQEELGLSGEVVDLIGVYAFIEMNQVIIAYHVKTEGNIELNEELTDIKKIDKTKLKGWPFGTGLAITDWIKKMKRALPENS